MATVSELTQRVIKRLSMVSGRYVQTYAEDVIADYIQGVFDELYEEIDWPQFRGAIRTSLDGVNGVVTANLEPIIKSFDDILYVFHDSSSTPIPVARTNVDWYRTFPGSLCYRPNPEKSKLFYVSPKTTTGEITIEYKSKPANFTPNSEVDMDEEIIIRGAVWQFAMMDGSDDSHIRQTAELYQQRKRQLITKRAKQPIALDPGSTMIPSTWM